VGYRFEWDAKKAQANLRKHGVSFAEAVTAFGDPLSMNMPDPDHSEGEQRFIVLGMSDRLRLLCCFVHGEAAANANYQCSVGHSKRATSI
jgi:uncharacterized DUF497 family protein